MLGGKLIDVLSALDRSASDQLKPSPERRISLSDVVPEGGFVLVNDDRPRPLVVGEEARVEALPLALPLPALTSRKARAPKLIRRPKGVMGEVTASPSSMAFSSTPMEPELELETLSLRERPLPKGDDWVGELPESPSVDTDIRRCR